MNRDVRSALRRPARATGDSIAEKVAFLCRAEAYPEAPQSVESIETHMSWVFLTRDHAYKLKKPVRYEFLDFSTLAARRLNCQRELRLNRRLAPDVYLGAVRLVRGRGGVLALGGPGRTLDWLVRMRRLPAGRMLDAVIRNGRVRPLEIERVSGVLSRFYQRLTPVSFSPAAYCRQFQQGIAANERELARPEFGLPARLVARLGRAQREFLAAHGERLAARARGRRIVEAHGDLRPEHICLLPQPVIIDCLEFNRAFRLLDPVDELAYLAMECERLGSAAGDDILQRYLAAAGEDVPDPLIRFYRVYRACLRAKLAAWHLEDHAVNLRKWRGRAGEYLELAARYSAGW